MHCTIYTIGWLIAHTYVPPLFTTKAKLLAQLMAYLLFLPDLAVCVISGIMHWINMLMFVTSLGELCEELGLVYPWGLLHPTDS